MVAKARQPPIDHRQMIRDAERELALFALPAVRAATESQTLRTFIAARQGSDGTFIGVPHHWAAAYHDGRTNPILPRDAKVLVWFTDRRDDPRPPTIRREPGNRLTKDEFLFGLEMNRRRRAEATNPADYVPFMVVAKRVDTPTRSHPFFILGLQGTFARGGRDIVKRRFRDYIRSQLVSEKLTATL